MSFQQSKNPDNAQALQTLWKHMRDDFRHSEPFNNTQEEKEHLNNVTGALKYFSENIIAFQKDGPIKDDMAIYNALSKNYKSNLTRAR